MVVKELHGVHGTYSAKRGCQLIKYMITKGDHLKDNARTRQSISWLKVVAASLLLVVSAKTIAERISDIRNTPHNLSKTGTGTVKADAETQVCVFCHTPHGATQATQGGAALKAPLWNRAVPAGTTYTTPYTSSSLDAKDISNHLNSQPGGSSVLCLSCHDGTIALGNVNVLMGQAPATIAMSGAGPGGTMPAGAGATSGFTRVIGNDLSNDHPISLTYSSALANADGELRVPNANQQISASNLPSGRTVGVGLRGVPVGTRPLIPLEPTGTGVTPNGQMQCATCHDPHLRETDEATLGKQKFLRGSRFQVGAPAGGTYDAANDIICLACHDKAGLAWAYSAHANPAVANETYKSTGTPNPATVRDFPANIPVWKASCLNCHDTHTVKGAGRLLREGTDNTSAPKLGGNPAQEETCYQCHSDSASSILSNVTEVPNVKSDFSLAIRMPIKSIDQAAGSEKHDIGGIFNDSATGGPNCTISSQCGKDFVESQAKLGKGSLNIDNRHAECTDCHNPHRVIKNRLSVSNPAIPDAAGTHDHDNATAPHTNLLSGALKGSWGVEPVYGSTVFGAASVPNAFVVKRGNPPIGGATTVGQSYATREYQICYKCHSNYAFDDNGKPQSLNTLPALGGAGRTPSGTNGLLFYTNQAMEFQAPAIDRGEPGGNHRSWHPVMDVTGRTAAARGGLNADTWLAPWRNNGGANIGAQTMYCSDCHGSGTANGSAVPNGGENGAPWGPHGSGNNFLLKGGWSVNTGNDSATGVGTPGDLCFKCHDFDQYARVDGPLLQSGWNDGSSKLNLHKYHNGRVKQFRCRLCHVAVPHGWKNKAFLANLNDVGPEAMCRATVPGQAYGDNKITNPACAVGQPIPAGTQICTYKSATSMDCGAPEPYFNPPYYNGAVLQIKNWKASNTYSSADCGNSSSDGPGWMGSACASVK